MKVFMYNKEEAKKNNCYTDKDPNTKVRLTFIPEVGGAVNLNTATSVLSSVNNVSK